MKKIFAALFLVILFASCSSDGDSASIDTDKIFLKKTISSYDGGATITAHYTYEGDTLRKVSYSDGAEDKYFYEEGNLSLIEKHKEGMLNHTTEFVYMGNALPAGIVRTDHATGKIKVTEFVNHSSDDLYLYFYDVNSLGNATLVGASSLVFSGDNLMTNEVYAWNFEMVETKSYNYDDKNNPMKNVYCNKVMVITNLEGGENNAVKISRAGLGTPWNITTDYTYNDESFPTTSIKIDQEGKTTTTEYFYE